MGKEHYIHFYLDYLAFVYKDSLELSNHEKLVTIQLILHFDFSVFDSSAMRFYVNKFKHSADE